MQSFTCRILLALTLTCSSAFAQESEFYLNVWGKSFHLGPGTPGFKRNENNLGIGIRYDVNKTASGGQFFADVNVFKNSTSGRSISYGAGYERPFALIGQTEVLWGTVVGVQRYENKWRNEIFIRPGIYPFIGLHHKDVTLNFGYLPGGPGVLFVYMSIKI